jgi:hypothetical protein
MPNVLEKLLKAQLGEHARVHLGARDLPLIRVVSSPRTRGRNVAKAPDTFSIVEKLLVYTGSCGTIARGGFHDLKHSGVILLVRSGLGLDFHVEMVGHGKELAVSRVSTGATARDLGKAILSISKQSARGSSGSELRIFRVAGMHVSAVWVHHPKKWSADVFVPYTPNFAGLRLGQAYTPHRLKALLKKQATLMILRWYDRYEKSLTRPKA